jgi:hypothetical protein
MFAKQVFADAKRITVPASLTRDKDYFELQFEIVDIGEKKDEADATGRIPQQECGFSDLAVDFCVHDQASAEKISQYRQAQQTSIEIDLRSALKPDFGRFRDGKLDIADWILHGAPRMWLFEPSSVQPEDLCKIVVLNFNENARDVVEWVSTHALQAIERTGLKIALRPDISHEMFQLDPKYWQAIVLRTILEHAKRCEEDAIAGKRIFVLTRRSVSYDLTLSIYGAWPHDIYRRVFRDNFLNPYGPVEKDSPCYCFDLFLRELHDLIEAGKIDSRLSLADAGALKRFRVEGGYEW